ncbi:hypothetical protein C8J56DRAFT_906868 [Mycena floridula]|nr:hypothetical protein C8J56DRAFT_906868 [Mycena floridula]
MTELPAAVVLGGDWFKNHVDETQEGHEPLLRVYDDKMRALVQIWELGKMELVRRNYQELQDIRAVRWEECDMSYIRGNEKQFWMRAPMEEVSVEFKKGQRVWAVLDEETQENLVRYSVAQQIFSTGIHTIGDNAMVAGMIVGEEIRVGIGERWHVDFKVVFDKHLPVNMVLGKRDIDKIRRTKIRVIRKGRPYDDWDDKGSGNTRERQEDLPEVPTEEPNGNLRNQDSKQEQDKEYSQLETRLAKGIKTKEIEIETSVVQESDSEEKVFNDLRILSSRGVPTIVLRTLQGDRIMAELNPVRLDNYCSKEAVTLLKTQMELDQDDLQEIQEDFMVTPIIGMRIKMEPWERPIRNQGRPGKTELNDTRAKENANQLNSDPREIVEMERLPTPPASVTLRTGKLIEKLRELVPWDPRVHSPIPVRVFNLRTTIKKPIIPELTEEERTAPQYAKRTGGPPLPSSSLSTLTYVQSKANESDEERTVVSDEMPDLISVSDSSETSSSDESDNMEIDQLAEEDSDSSHEENNDGYSILQDKRGRVFLRDPMQQDKKWESDNEEESDEEFKRFLIRLEEQTRDLNRSFSETMNNSSGTKAPNPSPVEETDIPMPQFTSLELELINTILIKPVDTRNEKVLSNLGNIRYHKATDERDEFGYTDYRNYQCFVVDKEPRELTRFNSYEPAPTGHPSLAGIDVLGVGCYQYFHGPTDNHPLRKFDNTASISSIVYDHDQLDEMRDQGLIQRIVDLKRYAEDIEIDTQLYRDRAFSIATIEESGTHLLPFDPTLNITMMHLYRTAAETYVVDMRDREAIERVNENEMLWSRKDKYLSTEKSNKVEVKCNAWTEHRWSLRRIRNEAVEILQELILILEEPFNMSVILEEIKLNTTAGHYWTLHCLYIRIIDNRYSEHFQGMNQECYHLDALANDEDEFLYYCAKVIDETGVNLGNTIRGLCEVDMLMAEDIQVLLNFNHLDHMRFYDRFGKKYPMAWAVF